MSRHNPNGAQSRRAFLQKVSLILGAAAIAPWNKQMLWDLVQKNMLPLAQADEGNTVDFVMEIAIGSGFPYGDLFPAPYFLRDDVDSDRGCNWERNEMRAVNAGNGRSLVITTGSEALAAHAENICVFDSMDQYNISHPNIWALRMAGWDNEAEKADLSYGGAALSVLFANAVALRRGANSPATRGWNRSQWKAILHHGHHAPLPQFEQMLPGLDQLREKFAVRPRTESNSELRTIIDTVRELNAYQSDRALRLKITNAGGARSAAEQGLALITTERTINITDDYNLLAKDFFATPGQDEIIVPRADEANSADERHLGEALLKTFLGFKHNLVGATSISVGLGHPHFSIVRLGNNSMRSSSEYLGDRLGAFVARAKVTDHPFRPGKKLFDHLLIMCSGDSNRDVSFRNSDNAEEYHWGESQKKGAVLIGGKVRGGYLGDTPCPQGDKVGRVEGFDPNSGGLAPGNRFHASSIYKTVALAAGIPQDDIREQMGPNFDAGLVPTLFKS